MDYSPEDIKVCWCDTETTGLDAIKNDVIQIAMLIEINGKLVDKLELKCQPYNWDDISEKALEVHGYGVEDLATFRRPRPTQTVVVDFLKKYVNPFDKQDKFVFAGYNAPFDVRMMREWFKKAGDKYFGSFFEYKPYDVYPLFSAYRQARGLTLENEKLVTAAAHFGLEFDAHDALADITVTRDINEILKHILLLGCREYEREDVNR
jgi:DNA polymerase III epsilon subunit-like protein